MTADAGVERGVRSVRVLFGTERFSSLSAAGASFRRFNTRPTTSRGQGTGETRPVRHSPQAPSASSGSEPSGHRWPPSGSSRSTSGWSACGEALTTSYSRRAARALGEALAAQLAGRRPPNALNAPSQPRQIHPEHRGDITASNSSA